MAKNRQSQNRHLDCYTVLAGSAGVVTVPVAIAAVITFVVVYWLLDSAFDLIKDDIWELGI